MLLSRKPDACGTPTGKWTNLLVCVCVCVAVCTKPHKEHQGAPHKNIVLVLRAQSEEQSKEHHAPHNPRTQNHPLRAPHKKPNGSFAGLVLARRSFPAVATSQNSQSLPTQVSFEVCWTKQAATKHDVTWLRLRSFEGPKSKTYLLPTGAPSS